jgi:hypothetical protein
MDERINGRNYSSSADEFNGTNFSQEKRMSKRDNYEKIITYSTATHTSGQPVGYAMLMLEGEVIDVSYGGLGMITSFELELGNVIFLNDIEGQDVGIVKSVHKVGSDSYRVGIAFS